LAAQLAEHYGTRFVPEFAREYLECTGPHYTIDDLEEIARGQVYSEEKIGTQANRVLICDTDLLVIKIWAEHAFGQCPDWVRRQLAQKRYDLSLLMGVDMPWVPDPLREHPDLRQYFYDLYLRELREQEVPFAEIWGPPARRFEQACFLIDELLAREVSSAQPAHPQS
jgi:NadR type nicotinamide-nucleotide adenylyltransferase